MCIRDRFKPYVFVLNPKCTANYKKSYIGLGKSDPIDAFVIADYAKMCIRDSHCIIINA